MGNHGDPLKIQLVSEKTGYTDWLCIHLYNLKCNNGCFISLQDCSLFETYNVELVKKDGQSLGIRIVGYVGAAHPGKGIIPTSYFG